jgi:hypothetical protein
MAPCTRAVQASTAARQACASRGSAPASMTGTIASMAALASPSSTNGPGKAGLRVTR